MQQRQTNTKSSNAYGYNACQVIEIYRKLFVLIIGQSHCLFGSGVVHVII
jgi:hypothetical protein